MVQDKNTFWNLCYVSSIFPEIPQGQLHNLLDIFLFSAVKCRMDDVLGIVEIAPYNFTNLG
jgi:hypothetical protein